MEAANTHAPRSCYYFHHTVEAAEAIIAHCGGWLWIRAKRGAAF
jgi:hypothetical protein